MWRSTTAMRSACMRASTKGSLGCKHQNRQPIFTSQASRRLIDEALLQQRRLASTDAATRRPHSRPLSTVPIENLHEDLHDDVVGENPRTVNPVPDFDNPSLAYSSKSTGELLRAGLSFGLCQVPGLAKHAPSLLQVSREVVGDAATDFLLKRTLFGQFCGGEDEQRIQPVIASLESAGIGSILDFAAEDDDEHPQTTIQAPAEYPVDDACDKHLENFLQCIRDVSTLPKDGFAAVKVTALCDPKLLSRMSAVTFQAKQMIKDSVDDESGAVSRQLVERNLRRSQLLDAEASTKCLMGFNDAIDDPDDLEQTLTSVMMESALSKEEKAARAKLLERGHLLAQEAAARGVRLLVDAEQVRFQPAIDRFVMDLQATYNDASRTSFPIVYNTYQCYLKDVSQRLYRDVERSEKQGFHFGAKLVRGAYMESERALAEQGGYDSPIHDTLQATHDSYNRAVEFLLRRSNKTPRCRRIEVMLATHNQESIEHAINVMNELGIDRKEPVTSFAQLYGMKDKLTFNLGHHDYRAYKYLPYGEIKMVMPYLIRRANENSSVAGGAGEELTMIRAELSRRLFG